MAQHLISLIPISLNCIKPITYYNSTKTVLTIAKGIVEVARVDKLNNSNMGFNIKHIHPKASQY